MKTTEEETQVISFRLSSGFIKRIDNFAKEKFDETGKRLSTSKAARMLLFRGLEEELSRIEKEKKKKRNSN